MLSLGPNLSSRGAVWDIITASNAVGPNTTYNNMEDATFEQLPPLTSNHTA